MIQYLAAFLKIAYKASKKRKKKKRRNDLRKNAKTLKNKFKEAKRLNTLTKTYLPGTNLFVYLPGSLVEKIPPT